MPSARPCGDGLLVETLRYADEMRAADPLFSDISDGVADQDLLDVATALIDRKTPRVSTDGTPPAPTDEGLCDHQGWNTAQDFDILSVATRRDIPCPLMAATRNAVTLGPQVLKRLQRLLT